VRVVDRVDRWQRVVLAGLDLRVAERRMLETRVVQHELAVDRSYRNRQP
jgi:hypothetical protein